MNNRVVTLAGLIAGSLCMAAIAAISYKTINDERGKHEFVSASYAGDLKTVDGEYKVEISEVDLGFGSRRIVHLHPIGKPSYYSITGHDYDGDGAWERIVYCGKHPLVQQRSDSELGCNSVTRAGKSWKFEACGADKDNVFDFSQSAIRFAIMELDTAMYKIYTNYHVAERWEWNTEKKQMERVFKRF